ncbi:hypothetical protein [Albibacterium indicum]|uniref:hypothetical protein n=1 Tax=Albibacterium indicum TaxID=2292082 RepID=UPI000E4CAFE2|nr:hypothetical protein [Pedobacter indicus]
MKKYLKVFGLILVVLIGFSACSEETVTSAEKDIVNNVLRTGNWRSLEKTISSGGEMGITTELITEGGRLEFKSDNKAWFYDGDNAHSVPYRVIATKEMEFDGMTYVIQENIVGKINTLTLINDEGATQTRLVFKRNRD